MRPNSGSYPLIRSCHQLPPARDQYYHGTYPISPRLWPKAFPASSPRSGPFPTTHREEKQREAIPAHINGAGQQRPRAEGLPDDLEQTGRWLLQVIKLRDPTCEILKPLHRGPSSESLIRTVEPVGQERTQVSSTVVSKGGTWDGAGALLGCGAPWRAQEGLSFVCGPRRGLGTVSQGQLSTLPGTDLRTPLTTASALSKSKVQDFPGGVQWL